MAYVPPPPEHRFKKGQSGNPSGMPKDGGKPRSKDEIRDVRAYAKKYTREAIDRLVKICKTGKMESARVAAAQAILDRGWGRPQQTVEVKNPDPLENLSNDKLRALDDAISALETLAGGTPSAESEDQADTRH